MRCKQTSGYYLLPPELSRPCRMLRKVCPSSRPSNTVPPIEPPGWLVMKRIRFGAGTSHMSSTRGGRDEFVLGKRSKYLQISRPTKKRQQWPCDKPPRTWQGGTYQKLIQPVSHQTTSGSYNYHRVRLTRSAELRPEALGMVKAGLLIEVEVCEQP